MAVAVAVAVDINMATMREVIEGWRKIKTSEVIESLREMKTSKVFVDGMPDCLSEDDVEGSFSRIGPVRRVGVGVDYGQAQRQHRARHDDGRRRSRI